MQWLRRFLADERGDVVENLAIILTVCIGLSTMVVGLAAAVGHSGDSFKQTIPGVTVEPGGGR